MPKQRGPISREVRASMEPDKNEICQPFIAYLNLTGFISLISQNAMKFIYFHGHGLQKQAGPMSIT